MNAQHISSERLKQLWQTPEESSLFLVQNMSSKMQIGQILMLDFRNWGENENGEPQNMIMLPDKLKNVIHDYALGSVALFRENLRDTSQTYQLIHDLQAARAGLPLFIAVDQEGGYVTRLREGTELPGNMALAATRDPHLAYQAGEVHGTELSALGFNLNFAPIIDVNVNQKNPVIGVRAYSSRVDLVNEMASAYINGLHSKQVLSSVKHFPGHGNVDVDSHIGLPIVPYSEHEWRAHDLAPFQYAIKQHIDAIMTAHVLLPALDDTKVISKKDQETIYLPATLSKKIIQGVLRHELHYDGLIITDAMDMGAIADNFGTFEAVEMALLAGVDLVLMPIHPWNDAGIKQLDALYHYLETRMAQDLILKQRIFDAAKRVIKTKLSKKIVPMPHTLAKAKKLVAAQAHKAFERYVAEKAITLIRNDRILPFVLQAQNHILLISDENARNHLIETELSPLAKTLNIKIKVDALAFELQKEAVPDELEKKVRASDFVILTTYNLKQNPVAAQRVIDLANAHQKPLVVIASCNPYDIAYLKNVKANIAIYGITGFDITNANRNSLEANIRAGISTLFTMENGVNLNMFNTPFGKLPVEIYSENGAKLLFPFGEGLTY